MQEILADDSTRKRAYDVQYSDLQKIVEHTPINIQKESLALYEALGPGAIIDLV